VTNEQGDQIPNQDTDGLVELIDKLERLLDNSELSELEVEAGSTGLVLRKASALAVATSASTAQAVGTQQDGQPAQSVAQPSTDDGPPQNAVLAPLTGLFYSSPSPGAQAYVTVGSTITIGQVIGLIEAMKLFNEIMSDRAGRVVRIYPQDGALVKAKQPLIEVEA
jgi:acetyl-CoA carboxylase biotin carboxyl carrier protein